MRVSLVSKVLSRRRELRWRGSWIRRGCWSTVSDRGVRSELPFQAVRRRFPGVACTGHRDSRLRQHGPHFGSLTGPAVRADGAPTDAPSPGATSTVQHAEHHRVEPSANLHGGPPATSTSVDHGGHGRKGRTVWTFKDLLATPPQTAPRASGRTTHLRRRHPIF